MAKAGFEPGFAALEADALTLGQPGGLHTTMDRYHGGRRPSSDDSLHSPTVIPLSALDKPSIVKRYHRWRTCSHTSPRRSPTMVTLHDTGFVECRMWNDGWTAKTVITCRSSASTTSAVCTRAELQTRWLVAEFSHSGNR